MLTYNCLPRFSMTSFWRKGTGGVGNLRTQTGFLSGFNRAAGAHTLGRSSFDLDGGKMAGIAQQNQKTARESHGGFGGLDEVFTPPPGSKEVRMTHTDFDSRRGEVDSALSFVRINLHLLCYRYGCSRR